MQSLLKGAIFFLKVQSYLNELWKGGLPWTANTIKVVNYDYGNVDECKDNDNCDKRNAIMMTKLLEH